MRKVAFLLSLVVVFMIPWENAVTVGNWGTLTRVAGALTAVAWLASLATAPRLRKPHLYHIFMFLFILWNAASLFWSQGLPESTLRVITYLQLAVFSWILWDLYTTPGALRAAMQAYVLGASVTAGSTILNYYSGMGISAYEEGRYAGAGLNAGDLALILALGLPVAWHLAASAEPGIRNRALRIINCAYLPAALFAMVLTASRMALFVFVPFALYLIFSAGRLRPAFRILLPVSVVAALLVLLFYVPQSTLERLGTARASIAAMDLGGRVALWRAALDFFSERPLLGVGVAALHDPSLVGAAAHNTFLSVAAELGLIGFLLFAAVLAIVVGESLKQGKWLSRLWITVLAIWAIGSMAQTWEFTKQTWLFLSLIVISASLAGDRIRSLQGTAHHRAAGARYRHSAVPASHRR